MADVRCHMCGKSNPADADICRYCQARLKPLGPSSSKSATPAAKPAGPPPTEGDESDWLRGLLDSTGDASSSAPRAPAGEPQGGGASAPDENSPAAEQPPVEDSSADWLARIVPQEPAESSPQPPPAGEPQGDANWLGEASPAAGSDDLSNWLASLREDDEASASSPPQGGSASSPAPAAPQTGQPVRLNKFRAEPPAGEQPPAQSADWESPEPEDALSADDLPDWLKALDAPAPADAAITPTPRVEAAPDWLSDFTSAADEPAVPPAVPTVPEEVPDWLRDFQNPPANATAAPVQRFDAPAGGQSEAQSETPAAPADVPDWLRDFQNTPASASAAPIQRFDAPAGGQSEAQSETPAAPADVPDWLRDFQNTPASATTAPAGEQSEAQSETPAAPADVPDWLRDFQSNSDLPTTAPLSLTEDQAEPEPPAAEGVLLPHSNDKTPDWLSEFYAAPTVDSTGKQTDADTDWMKDLSASSAQNESRQQDDTLPGADLPDWLRSASQQPAAQDNAGGDQELPDWLKKENGRLQPLSQQEPIADDAAPPFASREMSELLEGVSSESPQTLETSAAGGMDELEPAQLPNWLQAMRPVESGVSSIPTSEADDSRVEKSGPLAGLRGVLPGEDLVSKYRKPPIYTNKLQVSEKQHLHTSLLEGLVNEETQSQPLPGESIRTSPLITRLLVAALLIALIVLPPLMGFRLAVPNGLYASQPGVTLMAQSLTSLPQGSNVLVVADFEAGLTGELKAAAQPVLRDLQKRQARVVLASTLPAGPVLGEMLLKDAKLTPLANLGYLAGGAQTLKRLAIPASKELPEPLAQIAPFIYPGGRSWNDVADLKGLQAVTDFQRIVVLTDSVETARAWVEQVQPGLGAKTQLVMVSSAQAAPLLRTYLESGQVHGLVSGVAGGAAYEQFTGQPGLAANSWTAYQLSMLAVIFLIVAGAVAAGLSNLFRRNKKRKV